MNKMPKSCRKKIPSLKLRRSCRLARRRSICYFGQKPDQKPWLEIDAELLKETNNDYMEPLIPPKVTGTDKGDCLALPSSDHHKNHKLIKEHKTWYGLMRDKHPGSDQCYYNRRKSCDKVKGNYYENSNVCAPQSK